MGSEAESPRDEIGYVGRENVEVDLQIYIKLDMQNKERRNYRSNESGRNIQESSRKYTLQW